MIHRCCAFVERGPDCEMWQQRVCNSFVCVRPRANEAGRQAAPRGRQKKACYEISRKCTSNRRGESDYGGRLARSWSRSTYAG
jgi:hypothetical protein